MKVCRNIITVLILLVTTSTYSAEGMPQFNAESFPSQLFWLIITFLFLYLFIAFLVLPRIRTNLKLRKNKISNDIERAENLRDQTESIILTYNKKLKEAELKASATLKTSKRNAMIEFENNINQFKSQLSDRYAKAENELKVYKKNLQGNIGDIANEVSSKIIKKIFQDRLNDKDIYSISLDHDKNGLKK
tara:strand:+ start:100 stop:669 length:570 start_codon:yes stop_codon:yes gene_type:complete